LEYEVAVTVLGALGVVAGETEADCVDDGLEPTALVAVTLKV
jgi:hypothetical protein